MKAPSLVSDALLHCAVAGGGVTGFAFLAASAGFRAAPGVAVPLFAGVCLFVLRLVKGHVGQPRFGAANAVTLGRAAIAAVLAGYVIEAGALGTAGRMAVSAAAALALVLDGVDGRLARARGTATGFGARFDMEADALTVLVLAILVHRTGQAAPWVILLGLARYAFVLAGLAVPALAAELPPRQSRRAICAVTVGALVVSLCPLVPPAVAASLCATAGFLLMYSFGIDCIVLLRAPAPRASRSPVK